MRPACATIFASAELFLAFRTLCFIPAILSIFGYDPRKNYTGRSVLEAAGKGVKVPKGCVSFRVNLCAVSPDDSGALVIHCHNGGNIHGE